MNSYEPRSIPGNRSGNPTLQVIAMCVMLALGCNAAAQQPRAKTGAKSATHSKKSAPAHSTAHAATAPVTPPAPDALDKHVQAARTFQIAEDYDSAASEYRQAIAIGLQRIGDLNAAEGKYNDAIATLLDAAAMDPSESDIAEDLALAYIYVGELDNAQAQLDAVLKRNPENFRALDLRGRVEFLQGNYEKSANTFHEAFTVKEEIDVLYTRALAYLAAGKLPNATVLFDDIRVAAPNTPELHTLLARAFQATGNLDYADAEFTKALALNPKLPQLNFQLGIDDLLRATAAGYTAAAKHFLAETEISPRDYSRRYRVGEIAVGQMRFADGGKWLMKASALDASNPDPWFFLGEVYSQQGHPDQAAAALRKSIQLTSDPAHNGDQLARTHYMLGQALQKLGYREQAAAELAESQQLRMKSPRTMPAGMGTPGVLEQLSAQTADVEKQQLHALLLQKPPVAVSENDKAAYVARLAGILGNSYNNLGVIHARAGRYANAADEFKQAARWDNSIEHLDQNWALAAFRAAKYADAIAPLERLLHQSSSDADVREMLGLSYYMTNDFPNSAATFRPIADVLPDNPGLLLSAGFAFAKTGDTVDGQRLISRALVLGERSPDVHLMLGQEYAEQSDNIHALAEFNRALDLDPKIPEAHYFSGMVLFKSGKIDDAAQQFQTELELNPAYAPAMYQLAYIRLQQHKAADAIPLLSSVIEQQPGNSDAHYQLGKALLEQNNLSGAIRELEKSVQLHPSDYAYFQLSRAYAQAGRAQDASNAEQSYEKLKPKPGASQVDDK